MQIHRRKAAFKRPNGEPGDRRGRVVLDRKGIIFGGSALGNRLSRMALGRSASRKYVYEFEARGDTPPADCKLLSANRALRSGGWTNQESHT